MTILGDANNSNNKTFPDTNISPEHGINKDVKTNAMSMVSEQIRFRPQQLAFWETSGKTLTFGQIGQQIAHAQRVLQCKSFGPNTRAVIFAWPSAELFSWIAAVLGLGGTVIVMEPWMSGKQVTLALENLKPTHFIHDTFGGIWGTTFAAIRKIPTWLFISHNLSSEPIVIESVAPLDQAIITFTTGSTGTQKGVVRTHNTLNTTRDILLERTGSKHLTGPDLCVFSGFAMVNLATGRTTLLASPWKKKTIKAIDSLPSALQPVSLTTGPTFLKRVMEESHITTLRHIDVGGAPCDCSLLEDAINRWPQAQVNWAYGGTEVEPIAITSANIAIQKSKERGFFQVLFLGKPVPEILCENVGENFWVQGPHVSPLYIASPSENAKYKRRDKNGNIWHCTGDRVFLDANKDLWYEGRTAQAHKQFLMEQKIYTIVKHSMAFVFENDQKELCVAGVKIKSFAEEIRKSFPQLKHFYNVSKIRYDRRHHARIDRVTTVKKEL